MDRNTIVLRLQKPISRRHLGYILARKRRPSADLAVDLEQATGIERRCWMWPDKFPNPLIREAEDDGDSRSIEQPESMEANA